MGEDSEAELTGFEQQQDADDVIGVDLGGTKLLVARFDSGELEEPAVYPTQRGSSELLVDEIVDAIDRARSNSSRAVGIGVPSIVDFASGRARSSVNVPLHDLPLRELLTQRVGLPVFIDNDANCAALAEAHDGKHVVVPNLVMFTVGTGVGGGLVLNGKPYRGSTGAAAEFGHTLIASDLSHGPPRSGSSFPQPGSVESLGAGRQLDALAMEAAKQHPDSDLARDLAAGVRIDGRTAVSAAQAGDRWALSAIRTLGERLGVAVANAINTFDPDVVAIGGGVSAAGDMLLEPIRETAARFVIPGAGTNTQIRLSKFGPLAGVRGAALLALEESKLLATQQQRAKVSQ